MIQNYIAEGTFFSLLPRPIAGTLGRCGNPRLKHYDFYLRSKGLYLCWEFPTVTLDIAWYPVRDSINLEITYLDRNFKTSRLSIDRWCEQFEIEYAKAKASFVDEKFPIKVVDVHTLAGWLGY